MKRFVFRNATVEPLFPREETVFSGYGDVSRVPAEAESFLWFYAFPPDVSPKDAEALAEDFIEKLRLVLPRVPAGVPVELTELAPPPARPISLSDSRVADAVKRHNETLRGIARSRAGTTIRPAPENGVDWRLWFLAQMPFSPAKKNAVPLPRVPAKRKKCLVLDCDGTLWGGVLGEDGASGIRVGGDYPGNAFAFFQKKLVELAESGIVLAVCSKNDAADVRAVFENHPSMILRPEHVSAWRVNWNDKAENIREIAAELNLGADSFVFLDDSPRERARVADAFGGSVAVPEFPAAPYALPDFFEKLADDFFRAETLTPEDLSKARQYRDAAARAATLRNFASLEDYVASLEIRLKIAEADDFSFPRLAQLTQKTNQFNLATRRRSEAELRAFRARGNAVFSLAAKDRLGDFGIVGEAEISFSEDGKSARLENFMLSCRALGLGIETAFARSLFARLCGRGVVEVFAEYVPTAKNALCENFLSALGFSEKKSAGTLRKIDLREHEKLKTSTIHTIENDE